MEKMTYRQLAKKINELPEKWKNTDVSVYSVLSDEYFEVSDIKFCDDGVLDNGHPFLVIEDGQAIM